MGAFSKPVDDPHRVFTVDKRHRFCCPVTTAAERLAKLNSHLRDLTGEREPVASELRHIRGRRAYAEITANDNRLDEVDE